MALAGLLGLATAKQCMNMTAPVDVMARVGVFDQVPIETNENTATWTANYTSIAGGTNYTEQITTRFETVSGTYSISAMLYLPDAGLGAAPVVQVLTHGIGTSIYSNS